MRTSFFIVLAAAVGLAVTGCEPASNSDQTSPDGGEEMSINVQSSAFDAGEQIPTAHTGDGADSSPPLSWSGIPEGTRELALICDDPDAPTEDPWVHWVIYKLPATATSLPANVPAAESLETPAGARQGRNSFGNTGYGGPAPPKGHGVHHYHFKLYALDAELELAPGATKEQLLDAMQGHVLAQGELVGTYERE